MKPAGSVGQIISHGLSPSDSVSRPEVNNPDSNPYTRDYRRSPASENNNSSRSFRLNQIMRISALHRTAKVSTGILLLFLLFAPVRDACAQNEYAFQIARVRYSGGGDWYSDPQSLPKLLAFVRAWTSIDVSPREATVSLSSSDLFRYPYLYLTGHGNVSFSTDEATRLRRYLEGGGFLHIDDNYGIDRSIRREMKKVFPDREFEELPFDHGIYHTRFEFPNGLPKIHTHNGKPAQGFGIRSDDGRLMVFYSYESDLGDGWEPESVHHDPTEKRIAALRMGTNILTYALMH